MTNKVALRTVEEFMQDYTPIYQPIFGLFLGGKSQKYPSEVGKMDFKRANTVGDIRAKHITPKDTEIKQIAVNEGTKSFKKYFLGNQYVQSAFQDRNGIEDVIAQVLDEHNKQADDLLLLGDGTSAGTAVNNGLYWSSDPNYRLESSIVIAAASTGYHLPDLHTQIMATAAIADQIAGRKLLVIYGATACAKFDSLYANTDAPFKRVLSEVLDGYDIVKLPSAVTPSGANGWIIANLDQVKLHYTELPHLRSQGVNDEKDYAWHNFLMGSMMLEVLVDDAIIRQPCTFA